MTSTVAALLLALTVTSAATAGGLKDELVAMDKKTWTAWGSRDGKAFRDLITEDAVQSVAGADVATGRDKNWPTSVATLARRTWRTSVST